MLKVWAMRRCDVKISHLAGGYIVATRAAGSNAAADLVEGSVYETLTYYAFPDIHWQKNS